MTDTTNIFNNLKYAFVKDGVVVNTTILSSEDSEIIQTIMNKYNADSYHNVTNNEIIVGVNCHLINNVFTYPKPSGNYWQWNQESFGWEISVPKPSENHYWDSQKEEWVLPNQ